MNHSFSQFLCSYSAILLLLLFDLSEGKGLLIGTHDGSIKQINISSPSTAPIVVWKYTKDRCVPDDGFFFLRDYSLVVTCNGDAEGTVYKYAAKDRRFNSKFSKDIKLNKGYGVVVDPLGLYLYVADFLAGNIKQYNYRTGRFVRVIDHQSTTPKAGQLNGPNGLAFGPDGNLYVTTEGCVTNGTYCSFDANLPSEILVYSNLFAHKPRRTTFFTTQGKKPSDYGVTFFSLLGIKWFGDYLFVSDFGLGLWKLDKYGNVITWVKAAVPSGLDVYTGSLIIDERNHLVYHTVFTTAETDPPGGVLRYSTKDFTPKPARGQFGAIFVPLTTELLRPVGIQLVPSKVLRGAY